MSWQSFFWGCWKGKTSSQWWINRWDRQGGAQKESSWTTQCLEDDPFPTPRMFSNLSWCKIKEAWQKRKKSLKQKLQMFIYMFIHSPWTSATSPVFEANLPLACWPSSAQVAALEDGRQRSATALQAIPFEKVRENLWLKDGCILYNIYPWRNEKHHQIHGCLGLSWVLPTWGVRGKNSLFFFGAKT